VLMRIVSGGIQHETNTFATVPTTLADFQRDSDCGDELQGGDLLREMYLGTGTVHGGYLDEAAARGIEIEPVINVRAQPAGPVEGAAFEHMLQLLLDRIAAAGSCDAVALDLHGAMVTDQEEDAEGAIITAVRELVGSEMPILVTLDLHANITRTMAEKSDCLIGYDTYPHVDMNERGREAISVLHQIVSGEVRPCQAYRQLPLLTMPPMQCTLREPMGGLIQELHQLEQGEGIVTATIAMGFPFADIRDAGVTALVTANGDQALAEARVEELAARLWGLRDDLQPDLTTVEEAMRFAQETADGLVILADGSDNPGGGAPCDGTVALSAMIDADFQGGVVGVLYDPETARRAHEVGEGGEAEFEIGGKTDAFHGETVKARCRVKRLGNGRFQFGGPMRRGCPGDLGAMAVLEIGGVEVVVGSRRMQLLDREMVRIVGVEPAEKRLLVVKSAVHFRADIGPLAGTIFDADTPGIHRPDFAAFDYRKLRRPIYPLDPGVVGPGEMGSSVQ
jgi:microcystin degradation protein MlrC